MSNAPKFGRLAPAPGAGPTRWELSFTLGKLGLKPGQTPPSAMSAVAFGMDAFASPSGAAHGLTFIGGSAGRIVDEGGLKRERLIDGHAAAHILDGMLLRVEERLREPNEWQHKVADAVGSLLSDFCSSSPRFVRSVCLFAKPDTVSPETVVAIELPAAVPFFWSIFRILKS